MHETWTNIPNFGTAHSRVGRLSLPSSSASHHRLFSDSMSFCGTGSITVDGKPVQVVDGVIKNYGKKRTTYRMLRDGDSRDGAFRESLSDFQIRVHRLVSEAQARPFSPFSRF